MVIKQVFNKRLQAWQKYKLVKGKFTSLDIKQRQRKVPFKGIPKKNGR